MRPFRNLAAAGVLVFAASLGASNVASAAIVTSISDVNIPGLSFEVGTFSGANATGTSNGIAWSAARDTATNFNFTGFTCTNNCYTLPALAGAPRTDRLHASADFTISFGQTINWFLLVFSNDSAQLGGFDFGLVPTQTGGNVTVSGTQVRLASPATSGGWALFTGLSTNSLSHNNFFLPLDGYHVAWFVGQDDVPVPLPAAAWLLLSGLAGLGLVGRRRQTS